MTTLLVYGLIAVSCWIVASAIFTPLLAMALRGLAKNPRPAPPHALGAGRVRPAGAARGHRAVSSSRRGTPPRSASPLVLLPGGGEGPAAGDAAGPTNFPS